MGEIQRDRRIDGGLPDYEDMDGEYKGGGPARVWFEDGRELQVVLVAGVNPRVFCAICECLPQRANLMRCGNILCDRCVGRYTFLMERPCPCGRGGTWDCGNPFRYRLEDRQLNELMVECPNLPEGCEVFVPLMDLDRHLKECTKGPVAVPSSYDRQLFECVVSMVENVCLALNVGLERDMETTEEQIAAFVDARSHEAPVSVPEEPTMILTEVCSVAPENIDNSSSFEEGKSPIAAGNQGVAKISPKEKAQKKEKRIAKTPMNTGAVSKVLKPAPQGHTHRLKELEVLYTDEGVLKLLESGVTGRTRGSRTKVAEEASVPPQLAPDLSQQRATPSTDTLTDPIESRLDKKELAPKVVIERISLNVSPPEGNSRPVKRENEKRGISRELQALLAAQEEAGDALIKPEHSSRRDKSTTPVSSEDKNRSRSPEARKLKATARKSTGTRRITKPQPDPEESDDQDNHKASEEPTVQSRQQKWRSRSRVRKILPKSADVKNSGPRRSRSSEATSSRRGLDIPEGEELDAKKSRTANATVPSSDESPVPPPKAKSAQRVRSRSQASRIRPLQEAKDSDVEPTDSKSSKSQMVTDTTSTAETPVGNSIVFAQQDAGPSKEKTKAKSGLLAQPMQPKGCTEVSAVVPSHSNDETNDEIISRRTRNRSRARARLQMPAEFDSPSDASSCDTQARGGPTAPVKRGRSRTRAVKKSVEQESHGEEDALESHKILPEKPKTVESKEAQKSEKPASAASTGNNTPVSSTAVAPKPAAVGLLPNSPTMAPTEEKMAATGSIQQVITSSATATEPQVLKVEVKPAPDFVEPNIQARSQPQEEAKSESLPAGAPATVKTHEPAPVWSPASRVLSEETTSKTTSKTDPKETSRPSSTIRDPRRANQALTQPNVTTQYGNDGSLKPQATPYSDIAQTVATRPTTVAATTQKVVQDPRRLRDAGTRLPKEAEERAKPNTFKIPKRSSTDPSQELGSPIGVVGGAGLDPLSWQAQSGLSQGKTHNKECANDSADDPQRKRDRTARWNSPASTDSSGSRTSSRKEDNSRSSYGVRPDPLHLRKLALQDPEAHFPGRVSPRVGTDSRDTTEFRPSSDRPHKRKRSFSPRSKTKHQRSPSGGQYLRTQSHRSRSRSRDDRRARSRSRYRNELNYGPRREHDERGSLIRYAPNTDGPSCSRDYNDTPIMYSGDQQEQAMARDRERFAYVEAPPRDIANSSVSSQICDLPVQAQRQPPDTLCREIPVEPRMVIRLPQRKPSVRPIRCVVELPRPVFVPSGQEEKAIIEKEPIQEISEPRDQSTVERRIANRDPRFNRRSGPAEPAIPRPVSTSSSTSTSSVGPSTMSLDEMTDAIETALLQIGRHRGENSLYEQFTRDYGSCRNPEEQRVVASRYWAHYMAGAHRSNQEAGGLSAGYHMQPGIQKNPAREAYAFDHGEKPSHANSLVPQTYAVTPHPNAIQPGGHMGQSPHLVMQPSTATQQIHPQYAHSQYIDPFPTGPNSSELFVVRGRPGDTRAPMFIVDDDGSRFSDDDEEARRSRRSFGRPRSRGRGSNARWRVGGGTGYQPHDGRSRY